MRSELTDDRQRLDFAYREAVSRLPGDDERDVLDSILSHSRAYYDQDEAAAEELLRVGQAEIEGELPASELAAWTTVARVILNLAETTTRN